MRWTGQVARTIELRNAYNILIEKSEGKRPLGKTRSRWGMLEYIVEKRGGMMWTGFIWLRIGTGGGSCEHFRTFEFHKRRGIP
jgi:hypothetical protein